MGRHFNTAKAVWELADYGKDECMMARQRSVGFSCGVTPSDVSAAFKKAQAVLEIKMQQMFFFIGRIQGVVQINGKFNAGLVADCVIA